MAITHPVASVGAALGGSGTAITAAVTPGAVGDLLCVAGIVDGLAGVTFTISDTAGNTWTTAIPVFTGSGTNRAQAWYAFANGTSSTTVTVTSSGTVTFRIILIDNFRGVATDSSVVGPTDTASGSGTPTSGSFVLTSDECVVWSFCADSVTGVGNIDGSAATKGADDTQGDWSQWRVLTSRSGASITSAMAGSGAYTVGTVVWQAPSAATPTLDQEGFRWRNDDGSESTATYKAAQDTTISGPTATNTRLRLIVNAANDPASQLFKIQYRKQGATSWRNVDQFV